MKIQDHKQLFLEDHLDETSWLYPCSMQALAKYWDKEREGWKEQNIQKCLGYGLLSRICWPLSCATFCPVNAIGGLFALAFGTGCMASGSGYYCQEECGTLQHESEPLIGNKQQSTCCFTAGKKCCAVGMCLEALACERLVLCPVMTCVPEGPEACGIYRCLNKQNQIFWELQKLEWLASDENVQCP